MGKKKFVDKKSSATFAIVCADSNDSAGASSSNHVFVRVGGGAAVIPGFAANDPADILDSEAGTGADAAAAAAASNRSRAALSADARAEIEACGFPDDGYNYLQHLRSIDGHGSFVPAIRSGVPSLPPDVRVDDARVVTLNDEDATSSDFAQGYSQAALDELADESLEVLEDERFMDNLSDATEEELDDDFVVRANEMVSSSAMPKVVGSSVKGFPGRSDCPIVLQDVERPTRMLDLQFEKLVLSEYDDDCFDGPDSECSQSEGNGTPAGGSPRISLSRCKEDASELLLSRVCGALPATVCEEQGTWRSQLSAAVKRFVIPEESSVPEGEMYSTDEELEGDKGRAWDCDTIVSTLSNLDNHPVTIEDPLRSKRRDAVLAGAFRFGKGRCSPRDLSSSTQCKDGILNTSLVSRGRDHPNVQEDVVSSMNSRNSPVLENRKEHKVAVKQARREARVAKKALKLLYKDQRAQAQQVAAHGMAGAIRL